MELIKGIEAIGLGIFLKNEEILVISDTQIGYEESLNKKGLMIPRFQFSDMLKKIDEMIIRCSPKIIIINGDIKHEFGEISRTEWNNVLYLLDYLGKKAELILIKGNHDTILEPISKKRNIKLADYYAADEIYICHGHKIPKDDDYKNSKTIIIGHEHPALGIRERGRVEKFKCFLKGKYQDKTLIVTPSFNTVTEGSDILNQKLLSPFLTEIKDFEVFVSADKILRFGKVKELLKKFS